MHENHNKPLQEEVHFGISSKELYFEFYYRQKEYLVKIAEVNSFQKRGAIHIAGVATPEEMSVFRPAINEAVEKNNTEIRKMEERDTYGKAFLQITNLWLKDEAVRKITLHKKFASIAAQLLGVERVRIYHDQALYKEAGGGATPWHQDQYYWPLATTKTITMWMPLIDINVSMGMLTFAEGSHTRL